MPSSARCATAGSTASCPAGERHAIFERYDIVAGGYRDNVRCPRCGCRDRERLVHLFLNLAGQRRLSGAGSRVLHIAPERRLEGFLRSSACHYTSADLDGRNVDRQLDVTDMPDADASFELVICNHVFEHVPSDGAALDEIARVLTPNGVAIVQVPHATDLAHTHEDDTITDVEARIAAFGQFDHARLYGRDYVERLSSRALAFTPWLPDEDACERHGIDRRDPLMVGRRRDGVG